MSTATVVPTDSSLDSLFARTHRTSSRLAWCIGVALAGHVATGMALSRRPPASASAPRIIELDMAALVPPAPKLPAPAPAPAEEEAAQALPEPMHARPALAKAAAPAAAKAGALLTAKEDSTASRGDEPVDFVSDPTGKEFGGGVVARGGTADFGEKGAKVNGVLGGKGESGVAPGAAKADAITPASSLSRAARLDEPDACRGFFPRSADADAALVSLVLIIRPGGEVTSASILSENPPGQAFGKAAKSCLLSKRFIPALDREGKPTTSSQVIRMHFERP